MRHQNLFILSMVLVCAGSGFLLMRQDSRYTASLRQPVPLRTPQLLHSGGLKALDRRELQNERREFKQQRRNWMEQLHRCAPETDWASRDRRFREHLGEERRQLRQRLLAEGQNPDTESVRLRDSNRDVSGSWLERGSNNQSGRMHCVTMGDGETLYGGSSGGIVWRSDLNGASWQPLNDWIQFPDIQGLGWLPETLEDNARLLVLHKSSSLLAWTENEGQSWEMATGLSGPVSWGRPLRLMVPGDGSVLLLAAEWDYDNWQSATGLYVSQDRGSSFQQIELIPEDGSRVDIWFPEDGSSTGYLLRGNSIRQLNSDGTQLPLATLPAVHSPSNVRRTLLSGRTQDDSHELACCISLNNGESEIYLSTEDVQTWQHGGTAPLTAFMQNSFAVLGDESGHYFLGGVDGWRTADSGGNWTRVNNWYEYYDHPDTRLHADIPGIQCLRDPDGMEICLICTDGGIYSSRDALQSVQNISMQGLRISQYYGSYTHQQFPDIVYAGAQDQGFQRSTGESTGLIDFEQTISGDYAHLVSGDGGWSLWCVYPGFAMYYPDATGSNSALFWDFSMSGNYWLPPLMADPADPAVVWLAGGGNDGGSHLYRLEAGTNSISAVQGSQQFSASSPISALAVSPLNPDQRYLMTGDGHFWSTGDGGELWQQTPAFSGPEGHYFHGADIVVSPITPGQLWVCGSGYDNPPVFVSTDFGQTFAAMDAGLPGTLVYAMAISEDAQWLFAATELGPWVWDTEESSWQSIAGTTAPDQVYWNVEWVESRQTVRFVTYGRGIWDFTIENESAVAEASSLPEFNLGVFPNPANPSSRVHFELEQAGFVELTLYDIRGALREKILAADLAAGEHELRLNGSGLASGIYLLQLKTAQGERTIRLNLIK